MSGFSSEQRSRRRGAVNRLPRLWVALLMTVAVSLQAFALPSRAVVIDDGGGGVGGGGGGGTVTTPTAVVSFASTGTPTECPGVLHQVTYTGTDGVSQQVGGLTLPQSFSVAPTTAFSYSVSDVPCGTARYVPMSQQGSGTAPADGATLQVTVEYVEKRMTAISLTVTPSAAKVGDPISLEAKVTDALSGAPIAGRQVRLFGAEAPIDAPWAAVATAQTDADGQASAIFTPTSTLIDSFLASHTASTEYGGSSSRVQTIVLTEAPRIDLTPSSASYSSAETTVQVSHQHFVQVPTLTTTIPGAAVLGCGTSSCSFSVGHSTRPGDYSVTVADASGNSATVPFTVDKAASSVQVICSGAPVYSGAPQTPCKASAIGYQGWAVAQLGVEYTDNVNAGLATASATWAGDANHHGSTGSGSFAIAKAPSGLSMPCSQSMVYTGQPVEACLESYAYGAGMANVPVIPTYTNNVNAGTGTATGTWEGDANHTGASRVFNFTIHEASSSVTVDCPASAVYTGSPLEPCSATASGVGMDDVENLKIIYSDNSAPGTAIARATWDGDDNHLANSGWATFTIQLPPVQVSVSCEPGRFTFTGEPITPCSAVATQSGLPPVAVGVTYQNNTAAGTATASATHAGVTGSATFDIGKATIPVTIDCPVSISYRGEAVAPCTGSYDAGTPVPELVVLSYSDNVDVGTATASAFIPGDDNYEDVRVSETFAITPAPVTMTAGSYSGQFDGSAHAVSGCVVTGTYIGALSCTNDPSTVGLSAGSGVVAPVMDYGTDEASNFDVTSVRGQWTVTAAKLAVFVGAAPAMSWTGGGDYVGPVTMKVSSRAPSGLTNDADLRVELTGLVTNARATLACERTSSGDSATYVCSEETIGLPLDVYSAVAATEGMAGNFTGVGYAGLAIYDPDAKGNVEGAGSFAWPSGGTGSVAFGAQLNRKGTTVQGGLILVRSWADSTGSHSAVLKSNALGGLTFGKKTVAGGKCTTAAFNGKSSYTLDGETVGNQQFALVAVDCETDAHDQVILTGPGVFASSTPVTLDLEQGGTILVSP